MRLTKHNSDEEILAGVAHFARDARFYDPIRGVLFDASPCSTCGCMTAHGNELVIDVASDRVDRALKGVYTVLDFVEVVDFDDDGNDICENCEG